jgi:hypothetical protein
VGAGRRVRACPHGRRPLPSLLSWAGVSSAPRLLGASVAATAAAPGSGPGFGGLLPHSDRSDPRVRVVARRLRVGPCEAAGVFNRGPEGEAWASPIQLGRGLTRGGGRWQKAPGKEGEDLSNWRGALLLQIDSSSLHHRFEEGLGRGGVPQRSPQIACPCMLLFSAATKEEGRCPPGVE